MKKAVILRATGGELANQLWNYASVYAYCLERQYTLENPVFFEYGNYFTMPAPNIFFKLFFFLPFTNYTQRKNSFKRRLWRKLYESYARSVLAIHKNSVLVSDNMEHRPFYLPPTKEQTILSSLEKAGHTIYFDGWLFRNPLGLQKYRKEIITYVRPRADIEQALKDQIQKLKGEFKHIVGVHIRQGDYHMWHKGAYFLPQERVRQILEEYLGTDGYGASRDLFPHYF